MEAAPGMLGPLLADFGVRTQALVRGEVRADVMVVTASAPVWWLTRDGIGGGKDFRFRLWLPFTLRVASQGLVTVSVMFCPIFYYQGSVQKGSFYKKNTISRFLFRSGS